MTFRASLFQAAGFIFVFSLPAFAQTDLGQTLNQFMCTQDLLSPRNATCPNAQDLKSQLKKDALCEDLFGAACLNTDGSRIYDQSSLNIDAVLKQKISDARNKTAKALGYENYSEALRAKFKDAGFELRSDVTPEELAKFNFLSEPGNNSLSLASNQKSIFAAVDQCKGDSKKDAIIPDAAAMDPNALKPILDQQSKLFTEAREKEIAAFAKNLPAFINYQNSICMKFATFQGTYRAEDNIAAAKYCSNNSQIKNEAIDLYQKDGTSNYEIAAKKFVNDTILPDLSLGEEPVLSEFPTPMIQADHLRKKIGKITVALEENCSNLALITEATAQKTAADFVVQIDQSKPTVDALIDSFYGDAKKQLALEKFNQARTDLKAMVSDFVQDPIKKIKILSEYDHLRFDWVEKPPLTAYKKNAQGILQLDDGQSPPEMTLPLIQSFNAFLKDPTLAVLTTPNADYLPGVSMGDYKGGNRVSIMPALLATSLEQAPETALTVIAHETAHLIGPGVSRINGNDLRPEYKDLLSCLKGPESIRMRDDQADEVIADYLSAEVMAKEFAKIPTAQRTAALATSMSVNCMMESMMRGQFVSGDAHPEPYLRTNGIYGANPELREVMGCSKNSSKFKSCELKGMKKNNL